MYQKRKFLYTKDVPKLDLLIRTGGEKRLSSFLLWQVAELYFCDTLWPDFSCQDLSKALEDYTKREKNMVDNNFIIRMLFSIVI